MYRFQVAVADPDGSVGDMSPLSEAVTTFSTAPGRGPAVSLLPATAAGVLTLVWPLAKGSADSGGAAVTAYDVYATGRRAAWASRAPYPYRRPYKRPSSARSASVSYPYIRSVPLQVPAAMAAYQSTPW